MMTWTYFWLLNLVLEFIILGFIVVVAVALAFPTVIRQWRCKHDGSIYETQACDAICAHCGKNLGFIGTWRKKRKES
jgi:hypothetical protein